MKTTANVANGRDGVIWEDDEESIKKVNTNIFPENMDQDTIAKGGSLIFSKIIRKFGKNILFSLCLLILAILYYMVVFESIMPIFDSDNGTGAVIGKNNRNEIKFDIEKSMITRNRGITYLIIFHYIFIMFLIGFIRSALMNPGYYDKEYTEMFSLKKYQEFYTNYYFNAINIKRNSNGNGNHNAKKGEKNPDNNLNEFQSFDFQSNLLLTKKVEAK